MHEHRLARGPRDQRRHDEGHDEGQSFAEFALILILIAVVVLAILLIIGDDLRVWIITAWQSLFPTQ